MQTKRGHLNCSAPHTPVSTPRQKQGAIKSKRRRGLPGPVEVFFWAIALIVVAPVAGVAYLRYQQQFLDPPVALVLGGAPEREQFAAQFAKAHPHVRIWVSSGSNPEYARWVFDQAQVPNEQWALDYQAVDTVTNFTTLVDKLESRQIDQVYLITSDYHMRRASVVAQIVLGSRGINFKPVAIPTEHDPERPETLARDVRDGLRSLLWVVTGKTGSELKQSFSRSAQP
ncbi:MAG: YdcF family protein [Phormidesmis sp.]